MYEMGFNSMRYGCINFTLWTARVMGTRAVSDRGYRTGRAHRDGRFQNISVLRDHQNRYKVDDGKGEELGLFGLLLKYKLLDNLKLFDPEISACINVLTTSL